MRASIVKQMKMLCRALMDMAMEMSADLFLRNKSKTSNYMLTITFKKGEDFGAFYLGKGSGYRAFRIFGPSHQPIGLGTGPQIRKALYLNLLMYKKENC